MFIDFVWWISLKFDGFLKNIFSNSIFKWWWHPCKFLILGCLSTHTFIFFLTFKDFWNWGAGVPWTAPSPTLVFYGWKHFYIKTFCFSLSFYFMLFICAIVFQCNLVKHIKSVFWKIYFLSKSDFFVQKSEFQCWFIFRYGFGFSDYDVNQTNMTTLRFLLMHHIMQQKILL